MLCRLTVVVAHLKPSNPRRISQKDPTNMNCWNMRRQHWAVETWGRLWCCLRGKISMNGLLSTVSAWLFGILEGKQTLTLCSMSVSFLYRKRISKGWISTSDKSDILLPSSGGFLQPDQHALWDHHRVLHWDQLPCDVCRTKVMLTWILSVVTQSQLQYN